MASSPPKSATQSRLPSTRESRPALIGLAILLIVGGALASAYLALASGNRAEFLKVSQEIPQGAEVTEENLDTVSLPEGYEGGIPASDKGDLVGQTTTVRLLPGTVMSPDMVSKKGGIPEGKVQLSVEADRATTQGLSSGTPLTLYVGGESSNVEVPAVLVSVTKVEEGGITGGGSDSTAIPITVEIDDACNQAVAQGKLDDSIEVSVGTGSTSASGCGG